MSVSATSHGGQSGSDRRTRMLSVAGHWRPGALSTFPFGILLCIGRGRVGCAADRGVPCFENVRWDKQWREGDVVTLPRDAGPAVIYV
jgi:hypothetical protein